LVGISSVHAKHVAACCIPFLLVSALGQVSPAMGNIRGVVSDPSQRGIPGAVVTVRTLDGRQIRSAATAAGGSFLVPLLTPASYELRIQAAGFVPLVVERVDVHVGETSMLSATLDLERTAFRVDVASSLLPIDFARTQQAAAIDSHSIENLPINRREYLDLVALTPSVADTTALVDSADFRPPLTPPARSGFAGNNGRGNSFMVDGISINGASYNVRPSLPQTAVQEFQVNRNGYSAEIGGASGGVVNIVARSGSGTWVGGAFGYLRHSSLQARNYFDPSKTSYTRAQPGAWLSGPLTAHTFFFAAFESSERHNSVFVPILQDSSILSRLTPSQERLVAFLSTSGIPNLIGLADAIRIALTPSNNPAVTRIFQSNSGIFPFASQTRQFSLRLDRDAGERRHLFARLNFTVDRTDNSHLGALIGLSNGSSTQWHDQNYVLGGEWIFSPTWLSETRLAFAYSRFRILSNDTIGPEVVIAGYGQFGRNSLFPLDQHERYPEAQQTFQHSSPRNLVRFGADLQPVYNSSQISTFFGGRFLFGQAIPLSALIDRAAGLPGFSDGLGKFFQQLGQPMLTAALSDPITSLQAYNLGLPLAYLQGFGSTAYTAWRQNHAAFVQDQWRPLPPLSLSLGLRYQMDRPNAIRPVQYVEPRLGFAWAPANSISTVVRGGFGIFHQWVMPPIPFGQVQINRSDVDLIFLPLTGVPGIVNPQTGSLLTSADVYQTLLTNSVLGKRPIVRTDLASLGMPAGFRFPVMGGVQGDYHSPYSEQTSLGIEHSFGSTVVGVSYEFSRSAHLWRVRDHNLLFLGTRPDGLPILGRADPNVANAYYYESAANAFFSAVTFQASRRFQRHFGFDAHYTLGRATDEVTDFNMEYEPNNQFDARADRGLSPFHQKHRLVVSGILESPWTGVARHRFLAGWSFSVIVHAHSFQPFNILTGNDNVGDGQVTTHRPIGLGRDAGIGPNFFTMDTRLTRELRFASDRTRVCFTIEAFNLLNRTNFQSVNNIVGDVPIAALPTPLIGRRADPTLPFSFTAANDPRQVQLGVRFEF
jgi:hypothetical protein